MKRLAKMDPILIPHLYDCCNTLDAFRRGKVCTRGSKVKLFRSKIKYCGHILENGQRKAAPSKLTAVGDWDYVQITTVTKLKSFLGLAQYYAQFIKHFAHLAAPLTEMLKGVKGKKIPVLKPFLPRLTS